MLSRNVKRQLDLIYIDAGGGHRAAATALSEVVRLQQRPWDLRPLCIQELLDSIDFIRKSTGIQFQEVYNIMLRHGWTLGTAQLIPVMHLVIRMFHRAQVEVLAQHWARNAPDLVVSLIPHYNRAIREALTRACPGTQLVTILTDIADYPPHFWIERQDQWVICGSRHAARQARLLGLPEERILEASGMILHPKFYRAPELDREAERVRLGLRPDLPTGLVMFGGEGSTEMVKIARSLNASQLGIQLIFLCGKHQEAARELRAMAPHIPIWIEGFTREVPYHMALADFFIGKPGPGSISEALAMRLPVIVERNAWTLAHERFNADWVEAEGLGIVVSDFSKIGEAVRELLSPGRYRALRAQVAATRNWAVYEIPDMLEKILAMRHEKDFSMAHTAPVQHDKPRPFV
ncbi:MAG TPA: glycosyltransferase [Candidatus Acidoferrales bacterium]|jgi:hypothetical protein|nr:glycosyltransferase [Candidatus Acidoferrales bacterium]